VPVLRLHPDPGQRAPGGEPRLQLQRHHPEPRVPQEGALRRRGAVPPEAGGREGRRGLHLHQTQELQLEGGPEGGPSRPEVTGVTAAHILWKVSRFMRPGSLTWTDDTSLGSLSLYI